MSISAIRKLSVIAAMALAPAAALASSDWVSAGSTGTFDESCNGRVLLNGSAVTLSGGNSASRCTIRYQVVDTWEGPATVQLRTINAGYIDNGAYANVIVRLMAENLGTGIVTTLSTFDSNAYPASPLYQRRTGTPCVDLNFSTYAYFVEVDLVRTLALTPALRGTPEIRHVGVGGCL